jgi:hypothetical protein
VSRKRDYERDRRRQLVRERGAADPTPNGSEKVPEGLADQRGWTRPPVKDWREECRWI